MFVHRQQLVNAYHLVQNDTVTHDLGWNSRKERYQAVDVTVISQDNIGRHSALVSTGPQGSYSSMSQAVPKSEARAASTRREVLQKRAPTPLAPI